MGNGKLAVVMPTFRFDETAKHCIRTAASMGGGDVDVFIGDNSENPEKWDFLRQLAARSQNCHVFCHEKNIGGSNWPFLVKQTDHEFIAQAADDDFFTPDYYFAGRDILRERPDVSSASGFLICFSQKDPGLEVSVPNFYAQGTAIERIANYYYWGNSLCFSVYRAKAMERLETYFQDKPYWPSYMDQFQAYTLLCSGKYIIDSRRQLYVYNNQHWGTPERAQAQDARWFVASGLPAGFIHLNRLAWGADIVHFFNSKYRPDALTHVECEAVCDSLFGRMFTHEFSLHLTKHANEIGALFQHTPKHVDALRQIIATPWRDVETFLDLFATILGAFNEDLAARYRVFVRNSLVSNEQPVAA